MCRPAPGAVARRPGEADPPAGAGASSFSHSEADDRDPFLPGTSWLVGKAGHVIDVAGQQDDGSRLGKSAPRPSRRPGTGAGRRRGDHAAQPCAVQGGGDLPDAAGHVSGADRPGARPGTRNRPADRACPAPGAVRDPAAEFPGQVAELLAFLGDGFPAGHPYARLVAAPLVDGRPELFVLGSSSYGPLFAAVNGMSAVFAHHIARAGPGPRPVAGVPGRPS